MNETREYKKYEFCKSVNCSYFWHGPNEHCGATKDSDCVFTAKEFHTWIQEEKITNFT